MKSVRLKMASSLIDPRWFNIYGHGIHHTEILEDGSIRLGDETLLFLDDLSKILPGTRVSVWCDRFFYCQTEESIKKAQEERQKTLDQEKQENQNARNRYKKESEDFYANVKIPFKWDVGIKDVLSGLSETSFGDGRKRNTVEHLLVLENVKLGRLKRSSGDFLCASNPAMNGKRWSWQNVERRIDGNGQEYKPKITCNQCLKIIAKL